MIIDLNYVVLLFQKDEEVGMSVERQAEVRAKLYRMLGDNGQVASTAATRTRTPAAPSSSAAASRAATATAAPEGEGEGEAGEEPLGGDLYDDEGEFILDEVDDEYYGDDAIDGQEIHLQAMDEDWECAVCTLLNAPMTLTCNACGEHRTDLD